jgi:hypothetical protein
LVIGFIEFLQLVTTSKDYGLTVLHTSQSTIRHTRSSQSVTVFTSRCSVTASNGGHIPSSQFPNCPRPQLPASNSKISEQLPPQQLSNQLTHSKVKVKVMLRRWPVGQSVLVSNAHLTPLTCPAYNISARTAHKTPFLCCCLQPLPSNNRCIIVYFAVVA